MEETIFIIGMVIGVFIGFIAAIVGIMIMMRNKWL